ncbi:uncharacterized protein [Spinacia oleracea]|uniref:Uncharacterized protein n=1 Tax=Spinacia oleracea TaxID=3562 RepID=A0A9R0ILX1_SPIOL|nr:uncharacterized protein LOC110790953 [Spinacia oleracea]
MNEGICYFHPKEDVLGVCHLCLNERLLILSAKQGLNKSKSTNKYDYYSNNNHNNKAKSYVNLPKIFAITSFFHHHKDDINRHRHRSCSRSHHRDDAGVFYDADTTSTSLEEDESFISIKFGDNGVASWDKTSNIVPQKQHSTLSWGSQTSVKDATIKGIDRNNNNKSVVERAKPRTAATLRWRKRIGQLLQVVRWKKSSNATNVGGGNNSSKVVVEGVKVVRNNNNKGWIKTLKRSTKE